MYYVKILPDLRNKTGIRQNKKEAFMPVAKKKTAAKKTAVKKAVKKVVKKATKTVKKAVKKVKKATSKKK